MRTLNEAITRLQLILNAKGEAYGQPYRKVGPAMGMPVQYSLMVRMLEKFYRAKAMLDNPANIVGESLTDQFMDIAGYALLAAFESSKEDE